MKNFLDLSIQADDFYLTFCCYRVFTGKKSSYSNRIPFILLLSISTSIDAIHNLLPRSTSELLRIKTFTVTPNIETFHTLLYEVFIKRNQVISPGSKTFTFLRNTFLDLNQSIDGVIAKLNVSSNKTPALHFLLCFILRSAAEICDILVTK